MLLSEVSAIAYRIKERKMTLSDLIAEIGESISRGGASVSIQIDGKNYDVTGVSGAIDTFILKAEPKKSVSGYVVNGYYLAPNIDEILKVFEKEGFDAKISAIKRLRELSGCGLKEAKDDVDSFFKDNPSIAEATVYSTLATALDNKNTDMHYLVGMLGARYFGEKRVQEMLDELKACRP